MSKGSHEVTESAAARLCEWRGLNVCCKMFVARKRNCGDTILQTVDKTLLVSTPEAFFLFWVQKVCT